MKNLSFTIALLVFLAILVAQEPFREVKGSTAGRPAGVVGVPHATLSNINRISAWYSANGEQERNPFTGNSGLTFPRSTATAVYSAGILWSGKFYDGRTPVLRTNGQSYNNGTQPGRILGVRTGNAEDPNAADVRIWRIRRDYLTADLTRDAAEYFRVALPNVTQQMIDSLRDLYARDWAEWPWWKGAPFYDLNGDGVKDQSEDPGIADADQVVWYVCNDVGVSQPWSCPETGMEQQTTIWAYNAGGALGDVVFKRFRIFYKGTASTPDTAMIDSMYIGQWSDTDLGDSGDDLAGCDTTLSLTYCYNSSDLDTAYAQFGLPPPAVGYALLQGPIVATGNPYDTAIVGFRKISGFQNAHMSAVFIHPTGTAVFGIPSFTYGGAVQWNQTMRGLPPSPQGPPDPSPILDDHGRPTTFMFSGDPVGVTGWLDGNIPGHTGDLRASVGPGERQFAMWTGPFTMAVGDSQEVIVAFVAGLANDRLSSVERMKFTAGVARQWYNRLAGVVTGVRPPEELPSEFALEQNFPNPFNPFTVILYSLPVMSPVTLKVYNVLGQDVATLVNESRQPGSYEVEWNARGLSSGVYFYRLQAGEFVETRKLVLIK